MQPLKRHPGSQKTLRMRAATPPSAHRTKTYRHRTPVRLQQTDILLQLRPRGRLRGDALRPCSIGVLQAANLPRPHEVHTATLLANGHVLIAAGDDGSSDYLTDTICFDPVVNAWRRVSQLRAGREYCTATLLAHGGTLLAGGDGSGGHLASTERFDSATNRWQPAAAMLEARYLHSATELADGRMLVAGGAGRHAALASAEIFSLTA